jgi:hypothetical protein
MKTVTFELARKGRCLMEDITISKGWFQDKDDEPTIVKKKFCEHKANTVTLDYDVGIEYCSFCGALGHYNPDLDKVEWALPEYLQKQNYN